jgi:His-Xaa-Ser system protein HxsD
MSASSDEFPTFSSGEDEFGTYVRFHVDTHVFSEAAVFKTAYWFTEHYYVFISRKQDNDELSVEIRPKSAECPLQELITACGEFSNYLLDQEVRQTVIQETSEIRDTLIKKAFFEAKAPLPKEALSSETHLPTPTQSYVDDPANIDR